MPKRKSKLTPFVHRRKDGSIWAKGSTLDGKPAGHWEWYTKDGVRTGSGQFEAGEKVGEWKRYDAKGRVSQVIRMKAKKA